MFNNFLAVSVVSVVGHVEQPDVHLLQLWVRVQTSRRRWIKFNCLFGDIRRRRLKFGRWFGDVPPFSSQM